MWHTTYNNFNIIFSPYFACLDNASPGNFTCRNDSSIELPLAYLCEGVPPFYDDGGYRRKRHVGDYGHYFIDCPDRSDESPDTCGKSPPRVLKHESHYI